MALSVTTLAAFAIADHDPMGAANQILADRFAVHMSKTSVLDEQNHDTVSGNHAYIVYTRDSGRLADHPITQAGTHRNVSTW